MGIQNIYKTDIHTDRHRLQVKTTEKYWEGNDTGKMEDMPGTFLEMQVHFTESDKPSPLEALAQELSLTLLWERKKEITHEPKGYAKLKHEQIADKVRNNPQAYMKCLREKVKKKL